MIPRPLAHDGLLEDLRRADTEAETAGFTGKLAVTLEIDYYNGEPKACDWVLIKKCPKNPSGRRWSLLLV